ncbi:MAG: anti-anti-sigma factor, partial [Endozoicomonas sp.]
FVIVEDRDNLLEECTMRELNCEDNCEQSNHARVLDAHRVLMNLNENNRKAFSDLMKQLERYGQPEPSSL